MKGNIRLALGLVLVVAVLPHVRADYEDLCARFADGTKMREPGNCAAYIVCNNGIGTVTTCPNNQLYDKETKNCVATLSDDYCGDQCKGSSGKWVADSTNCDGYYYCGTDGASHGACPHGYKFNENRQMCVFPSESDCYGVSNICGLLPRTSESFVDPDNCAMYYSCTRGDLRSQQCARTNLYFDRQRATCISKYEVSCSAHPIPSRVCGTETRPVANRFVNDEASCRGYYYCAYKGPKLPDLNPIWNQCPEGLFFSAADQSCKDPSQVLCSHNRCEGRGNLLVIAQDAYCQHYFECGNGQVLRKLRCPRDMFFKEHKQACTYDETSYPVC